jgi:RNA polymerase sigma-70 factor (sigma-E family)
VQNALASVLASWRRIPEVDDLDAYVYTALVNARHRWWSRRWHGEIPSEQLPEVAIADETGRFDRHEDMLTVLGTLPTRQRQALVLRYFEDLTEAQTARILGCSVGTVKSQTARGLDKMRAALAAEPGVTSRASADVTTSGAPKTRGDASTAGLPPSVRRRAR